MGLLLVAAEHARELLVEAGQTAAAVHQLLLAAGPGRVGGRIDVEGQLLAGLAPGRAGLVGCAVVQTDVHEVIVGMDALFHGLWPSPCVWKPGLIGGRGTTGKPRGEGSLS